MKVADLGETEVVTATQANPARSAAHIIALEGIVDKQQEEIILLKLKIDMLEQSTITKEQYDTVCKRLQEAVNEVLPF